jgi:hypothetical protein
MNFEDALAQMREGNKITHPNFDEDIYFMGCYVSIMGERLSDAMSIVKMKGDYQHEDMGAGSIDDMFHPGTLLVKDEVFAKPCKHGYLPQLDLFLVMSDAWIVIE